MRIRTVARSIVLVAAFSFGSAAILRASSPPGQSFATARDAVTALQRAASTLNYPELRTIFGPGLDEISNPDRVQATNEVVAFAAALRETNQLVAISGNRLALVYGEDRSQFPVPLIQQDGRWLFDTDAGAEELINRRIGRNELAVLDVVRTYVQAQREYAALDRDDDQVLEYARKFASSPGSKDGLFWTPDLDGTLSPLGPLFADAHAEGYRRGTDGEPKPFHGYYFRILTKQGKNAPGGAYNYVINDNMIGGFALVAWPAEYDETGVMTFLVNQQGRVLQKDLGPKTSKIVASMKAYDPDSSWRPSKD